MEVAVVVMVDVNVEYEGDHVQPEQVETLQVVSRDSASSLNIKFSTPGF